MLEGTENTIKLLSEATNSTTVNSLTATKLLLEELYESSQTNSSMDEIHQELARSLAILNRSKLANSPDDWVSILSETKLLYKQLATKYSDFLPNKIIKKYKFLEKQFEGIEKLNAVLVYMSLVSDDDRPEDKLARIIEGLANLSVVLEDYISYFEQDLVERFRRVVLETLVGSNLYLKQADIAQHQKLVNYLTAFRNTARGILWQIDNYEKEKKLSTENLLDWLSSAPSWVGDDFEESLDYINQARK